MYDEIYSTLIPYLYYDAPITQGVLVMIGLSWLICFLSKWIFKEYFANKFWKAAFLTMIAVPSLIEIYLGSINALGTTDFFVEEELAGLPETTDFSDILSPLFLIFFAVYLIHFITRLLRYGREKYKIMKAHD